MFFFISKYSLGLRLTPKLKSSMDRARRLAPWIVVVVATALILSACGNGGMRVYRDSTSGFRFDYPTRFQVHSFFDQNGIEGGSGGVTVANKTARGFVGRADNGRYLGGLQPGAVVFTLSTVALANLVATSGDSGGEAHFPLRAASFKHFPDSVFLDSALWRELGFRANGERFLVEVYFGPRASEADRAAIWQIVSSLRFRSLHAG